VDKGGGTHRYVPSLRLSFTVVVRCLLRVHFVQANVTVVRSTSARMRFVISPTQCLLSSIEHVQCAVPSPIPTHGGDITVNTDTWQSKALPKKSLECCCKFPEVPPVFSQSTSAGVGRDSSVGIATHYGLDGPGIESRWGRDFPCTSR
jgi:hypothetical protein